MIPDRLTGCDKRHPDTPSRIVLRNNGQRKKKKLVCNECTRVRVAEHRVQGPYGVLPRLTWTPPEFTQGLYS